MAIDYSALVDLFRQSFSPLTQLSAGRLAIAQAQQQQQAEMAAKLGLIAEQERFMRGRQMAADDSALQRQTMAQQFQEHLAGLGHQADLERQLAVGKQGARLNRKSQRSAAADNQTFAAENAAAEQGLVGYNYSHPALAARAGAIAEKRNYQNEQATELLKEKLDAEDAYEKIAAASRLSEEDKLALAKPKLRALTKSDDKLRKQVDGAKSMRELAVVLSGVDGADLEWDGIQKAIALSEQALRATLETDRRLAENRIATATKLIMDLPAGATADIKSIRAARAERDAGNSIHGIQSAGSREGTDGSMESAIDAAIPRGGNSGGEALGLPRPAPEQKGNALTIGGGAALTALTQPAARSAISRFAAAALGKTLSGALGLAGAAGRAVPYVGPGLMSYGAGNMINSATGDAVPNWLAEGFGGTISDEAARQHEYMARVDRAVRQASAVGDYERARKLRSLGTAPAIDFTAIDQAAGAFAPAPRVPMLNFGY